MAGAESEDGVERRDGTTTSGEREQVGIAIYDIDTLISMRGKGVYKRKHVPWVNPPSCKGFEN